jgi:hypothetical protein
MVILTSSKETQVTRAIMDSAIDLAHLRQFGWIRISSAVPTELCERLVQVLERELGVPVRDPSRWDDYGGRMRDFVPLWGHQAQWAIRQHPNFHRIWATLWNTEKLWVSLDSCRFTPPWKPGYAETYGIHWDHDPWDAKWRMLQGVLALTNTDVNQGGFRCVPSLYYDRDKWPTLPTIDPDGDASWLADTNGHEIVIVPARAGDLIVWDYRLPHGNSRNVSAVPRIAFYATMFPASNGLDQHEAIESRRTGRCVSWWRKRPGYDRVEPWPPAELTALGRRLLGLDSW